MTLSDTPKQLVKTMFFLFFWVFGFCFLVAPQRRSKSESHTSGGHSDGNPRCALGEKPRRPQESVPTHHGLRVRAGPEHLPGARRLKREPLSKSAGHSGTLGSQVVDHLVHSPTGYLDPSPAEKERAAQRREFAKRPAGAQIDRQRETLADKGLQHDREVQQLLLRRQQFRASPRVSLSLLLSALVVSVQSH